MAKNSSSDNAWEKPLLVILSLISLGLLVAIVYVWYTALSTKELGTKPGDFLKVEESQNATPSSSSKAENEASPSMETTSNILNLAISGPKNEAVVDAKTLTISGTTAPNATITVSGGKAEVAGSADLVGGFQLDVTLEEGENNLVVTAFDEAGSQVEKSLTIVYVP